MYEVYNKEGELVRVDIHDLNRGLSDGRYFSQKPEVKESESEVKPKRGRKPNADK